jgi:hypothetical protein
MHSRSGAMLRAWAPIFACVVLGVAARMTGDRYRPRIQPVRCAAAMAAERDLRDPFGRLVLVRLADDGYSGIEIWDADVAGPVQRVLDAIQ